jgi:hypothetical protein
VYRFPALTPSILSASPRLYKRRQRDVAGGSAILGAMSGAITIRRLEESRLDTMLDWAADEGWNPGLDDAHAFHAADPDGFRGLFVDDELVVTISAVRYDSQYAFVGFYICRAEHRGEGLGLQLFQTTLDTTTATTIGLDGVTEQEPNYARSGFVAAHRSVRFGGRPNVASAFDSRVRTLGAPDVAKVDAYERGARVFPADRRTFLERWLGSPRSIAMATERDGAIDGYGVIRQCRSGYKIGPLFCDGRASAAMLVGALVSAVGTEDEVFLDVPYPNSDAVRFARDIGLEPTFETVRMYRGPDPEIALGNVFGITTFELG